MPCGGEPPSEAFFGRREQVRRSVPATPSTSQSPRLEHALLAQAISDIQGSIHANDSKSSAGLVVQGLLATAVVAVVGHLGSVYEQATGTAQAFIKVLLAGLLVTALLSIVSLIRAVRPYEPTGLADRLGARDGYDQVLFPNVKDFEEALDKGSGGSSAGEFERLVAGFEANAKTLGDPDVATREYVAELLKVADIRAYEAKHAKRGFTFLGIEAGLVILYLALVGCVAGHLFSFTAVAAGPTLQWSLTQQGELRTIESGSRVALAPSSGATVRLLATDRGGLARVRLARRTTFRCVGRNGVRNVIAGPPSFQRVRLSDAPTYALDATVRARARRCPLGLRYAGFSERFYAVAESGAGTRAGGWLLLNATS